MRKCWRGAAVVAAVAAVGSVGAASAQAQSPAPVRLVTFAARTCPSYDDISANRARNNIQESLKDLGPDTTYVGGESVLPGIEQTAQPNCSPLPDWRFTLGTGYRSRAVSGTWGSLSIVTSPFPTAIRTVASTPLLNRNGDATGTNIAGAVTIQLTAAEAEAAARANGLWAQGGTPADPILDVEYPQEFGFGALRCSVDNLNGDNVEFITYPQGARHVFCFAYYVVPPPTSGTIVVRKEVSPAYGASANQTFRYTGDISFTPDQSFSLTARPGQPASTTFYRAAGQTWSFKESDLPGWERTGLSCTSATGASQTTTDRASGQTAVTLGAGDRVTCTYVNQLAPPPAGLTLSKRTLGGTGSFAFNVDGTGDDPVRRSQTITTTVPGDAVAGAPLTLPAGPYVISEKPPAPTSAGRWALDKATCDGDALDITAPLRVSLTAGRGSVCQVTNRFVPAGSITLRKRTDGATGAADFVIGSASDPTVSFAQRAVTTSTQTPALAKGDDTSDLPLGTYEIVETNPVTTPEGSWTLESVLCNGRPIGSAQGRVEVTLTAEQPSVDCLFIDRFTATPEPENPSLPAGPGTPPAPPDPSAPVPPPDASGVAGLQIAGGPNADLEITKTVSPLTARPGELLRYRIVVVNRGPGIAYDVVGTEVRPPSNRRLRLRVTGGAACQAARPARCRIGALRPGRRVEVIAEVRAGPPGRVVNRVSVSSSTTDPDLANNRASATEVVRGARRPRFTG